jgi:hypothetical protein
MVAESSKSERELKKFENPKRENREFVTVAREAYKKKIASEPIPPSEPFAWIPLS